MTPSVRVPFVVYYFVKEDFTFKMQAYSFPGCGDPGLKVEVEPLAPETNLNMDSIIVFKPKIKIKSFVYSFYVFIFFLKSSFIYRLLYTG